MVQDKATNTCHFWNSELLHRFISSIFATFWPMHCFVKMHGCIISYITCLEIKPTVFNGQLWFKTKRQIHASFKTRDLLHSLFHLFLLLFDPCIVLSRCMDVLLAIYKLPWNQANCILIDNFGSRQSDKYMLLLKVWTTT